MQFFVIIKNVSMYEATLEYARKQDREDVLRHFKDKFIFPQHNGQNCIYFCGNSLGLQSKNINTEIQQVLSQWAEFGVEGHFTGEQPWTQYHKLLVEPLTKIIGAKPHEIVVMNTLTVNLHLLMVSFYQPTATRYKILMEGGAFPSDQYAIQSQVKFHGYNPEDAIIEIEPREGEHLIRTEDIVDKIEAHQDEIALVLFGGINYYTGQFFDLEAITRAGHLAGAKVGFDLAHAAGNVPMKLHEWKVDFAMWCSYKYMNSSPGGMSGVYINEKYADRADLPRFAGWWGHDEERRFLMEKAFVPMHGAEGWQLSNAPILALAPYKASLDLFEQAGFENLRAKSIRLTGYLEFLLQELNQQSYNYEFITPSNPAERGCQLSVLAKDEGKALFNYLIEYGVILDWREPNVIRVAPTPMYNTFEEVWQFVALMRNYRQTQVSSSSTVIAAAL